MWLASTQFKALHWFCTGCEPVVIGKSHAPNASSCEIANTIINGIAKPLKNMMENLVKPITESLELLKGALHPQQAEIPMNTDATSGETKSPVKKDTASQVINEYMDHEHRKYNVGIHGLSEDTPSQDKLIYCLNLGLGYQNLA